MGGDWGERERSDVLRTPCSTEGNCSYLIRQLTILTYILMWCAHCSMQCHGYLSRCHAWLADDVTKAGQVQAGPISKHGAEAPEA